MFYQKKALFFAFCFVLLFIARNQKSEPQTKKKANNKKKIKNINGHTQKNILILFEFDIHKVVGTGADVGNLVVGLGVGDGVVGFGVGFNVGIMVGLGTGPLFFVVFFCVPFFLVLFFLVLSLQERVLSCTR